MNKKEMSFTEKLIEAASQEGFKHEFNVRDIFESKDFQCLSNEKLLFNSDLHEIDLISIKDEYGYIVECKGCSPSNYLILVKEANNYKIRRASKLRLSAPHTLIDFQDGINESIVYTGDFFTDEFKRASKNDNKNNFYKATEQITNAILAVKNDRNLRDKFTIVIPLIIINCKIYVIDYQCKPPIITEYKWVLNRLNRVVNSFLDQIQEHTVPVINIKYLDEFLKYSPNNNKLELPKGSIK